MSLKPELTDADRLRHMGDAANAAMECIKGRSRADLHWQPMLLRQLGRSALQTALTS